MKRFTFERRLLGAKEETEPDPGADCAGVLGVLGKPKTTLTRTNRQDLHLKRHPTRCT